MTSTTPSPSATSSPTIRRTSCRRPSVGGCARPASATRDDCSSSSIGTHAPCRAPPCATPSNTWIPRPAGTICTCETAWTALVHHRRTLMGTPGQRQRVVEVDDMIRRALVLLLGLAVVAAGCGSPTPTPTPGLPTRAPDAPSGTGRPGGSPTGSDESAAPTGDPSAKPGGTASTAFPVPADINADVDGCSTATTPEAAVAATRAILERSGVVIVEDPATVAPTPAGMYLTALELARIAEEARSAATLSRVSFTDFASRFGGDGRPAAERCPPHLDRVDRLQRPGPATGGAATARSLGTAATGRCGQPRPVVVPAAAGNLPDRLAPRRRGAARGRQSPSSSR